MNQKKIGTAFIFVCIILSLNCTNLSAYREITTTNYSNWPYFYLVKKDGKTHYILGELHVTVALDELPCADEVKHHLQNSTVLFSEKSNLWEAVFQKERTIEPDPELEYLYTQNGLDAYITNNDFAFRSFSLPVQNFFKKRGISDKLTYPGYNVAITRLCFTEAYGPLIVKKIISNDLIKLAKLQGIPIKPLDTPELRVKSNELFTLESIESDVQIFSECPKNVKIIRKYYLSERVLEWDLSENYISILLRNRNQEWLSKFLLAHKEYSQVFISAGSLHFTGPDNLLDMLIEEGFEVSLSTTCKVKSSRENTPIQPMTKPKGENTPIQPMTKPKGENTPMMKPLTPSGETTKLR